MTGPPTARQSVLRNFNSADRVTRPVWSLTLTHKTPPASSFNKKPLSKKTSATGESPLAMINSPKLSWVLSALPSCSQDDLQTRPSTSLVAGGVEVCFTNPGTSEMHFVAALDKIDGMRCVLCLFEGVATGAADGYARMAGKPAATLLPLGPGLANGIANLHNPPPARSPLVN